MLLGIFGLGALASAATTHRSHNRSRTAQGAGPAGGLGQLSGLLPRNHLTLGSAIQVNLSNETVRLPLYKGDAPVPNHPGQKETVRLASHDPISVLTGPLPATARSVVKEIPT